MALKSELSFCCDINNQYMEGVGGARLGIPNGGSAEHALANDNAL